MMVRRENCIHCDNLLVSQVYVMENEAVILVKFQRFLVTDIKQHGTVEWSFSSPLMKMKA